jgi:hypothetical protein
MAHSVSEAAARAVKNSQKKTVETRIPEQVISDIRKNLAAKLFVTPDDQRFLLQQYDNDQGTIQHLAQATAGLLVRAESAEAEVADLKSQVDTLSALRGEIDLLRAELSFTHGGEA